MLSPTAAMFIMPDCGHDVIAPTAVNVKVKIQIDITCWNAIFDWRLRTACS
eukprot:m.52975 g.52975  ORF g.52975 m.52975 type:complete len:51 (+) comp21683_c0_seq4:2051-2203(+)